ncbi:MAG TPA: hypothetical protein PLZ36_12185, partial [Armatimonadota bacterium]|nr:hypothetical protein [Armatimonadota bacterium]
RFPGHAIVGACNLTLDPWTRMTFDLAGPAPARVDRLTAAGAWEAAEVTIATAGQRCRLALETSVSVATPLVLDLVW